MGTRRRNLPPSVEGRIEGGSRRIRFSDPPRTLPGDLRAAGVGGQYSITGDPPHSPLNGGGRSWVGTSLCLLLLFPLLVGFRWPWETARLQREAASAFEKGAYGHAAEAWGALYQERRGDPKLAYNLGTAKLAQKEYASAIEVLGQGLEHTTDPQTINELRYNRGNAYYRLDDLERAAVEYEAALKADPEDEDAAYNLALCRRKQQPPPGGGGGEGEDEKDQNQSQGGGGQGQQQEQQQKQSGGMTEEQVDRMLERLKEDEESFRTYFTPRPSIQPQPSNPLGIELDDVMKGMRGEGSERDW